MKKISLFLVLAMSVMLLAGCSNKKNDETTQAPTQASETEAPTTAAEETEPETEVKETRDGYVRSHLTGQWIDEEIGKKRPIAVMINNIQAALPAERYHRASFQNGGPASADRWSIGKIHRPHGRTAHPDTCCLECAGPFPVRVPPWRVGHNATGRSDYGAWETWVRRQSRPTAHRNSGQTG